MTQGLLGPDGSYTLHGLKPGAQYVFYLDAALPVAIPTPPHVVPARTRSASGAALHQP